MKLVSLTTDFQPIATGKQIPHFRSFVKFNFARQIQTFNNHKGLQRTTNEYAEERRIYKDLISKTNNVEILNSASRIL